MDTIPQRIERVNKMQDYKEEYNGKKYTFICWGNSVLLAYVIEDNKAIWQRPVQACSGQPERLYVKEPDVPKEMIKRAVEHYRMNINYITWDRR